MDSSHPREDISVTAETRRAVKKGGRNRTTRHPNPALYDWNQHRSHLSHTTRIIKSLATWHPLFSVSRPLAQKAERQETENETSRERTLCTRPVSHICGPLFDSWMGPAVFGPGCRFVAFRSAVSIFGRPPTSTVRRGVQARPLDTMGITEPSISAAPLERDGVAHAYICINNI